MCGELREEHIGQNITVGGWVANIREIGGVVFVVLRDRTGILQLAFRSDRDESAVAFAHSLGREFVVMARGRVQHRGEGNVNPRMPTGAVELVTDELVVVNAAETPPIEVRDDLDVQAELRLRYRYLDLRRPCMQHNIRLRHRVIKAARDKLDSLGFVEIETPLLTTPTPEGARDFLVPSRLHHGEFYALPQSPQIFKQILMMSGFDRYFQFARCLRDEDKRGDRQPEHTQLDLEMSFVEPKHVQATVEQVFAHIMAEVMNIEMALPLPHLSHEVATERYGSDKPDTRFELPLVDLSAELADSGFGVFTDAIASGRTVRALCIPGGHGLVSKGQFKKLEKDAKGRGAKGLAFIRYTDEGLVSPIVKFLSQEDQQAIATATSASTGDLVLFVADRADICNQILAAYREQFADKLELRDPSRFHFLWVDGFPQFDYDEEKNEMVAEHHPFVMPENPDELLAFAEELERSGGKITPRALDHARAIRATHYDLVVNGVELGSGSVRITDPKIQRAMFTALGISKEEAEAKFGFLLEAMRYGAPPMAGIGIGTDRLLMVLLGLDSIQDVIVFPKTAAARGLLDGCPSPADPDVLAELGIRLDA